MEEEVEVLEIQSCIRALVEEEVEILGIQSCVHAFVAKEAEVLGMLGIRSCPRALMGE